MVTRRTGCLLVLLLLGPFGPWFQTGAEAGPQASSRVAAHTGVGMPASLKLGVHPYLPELYIKQRFMPLVDHLSAALGIPVVLSVSADYRSHILRVGEGDVDFAYMGPASYVKLVDRFGTRPLLARQAVFGEPTFNGVIFVRDDSRVTSLEGLRGKRFAFGDRNSTMSYLVPMSMLLAAGVGLNELGGHEFFGSHQGVALAVLRRQADAGAVKQEVYARYRHRGLRAVVLTPQISEHLFVARDGLSPALVAELRARLLALDESSSGREVLRAIKPSLTAMVPVADGDYDSLRRLMAHIPAGGADRSPTAAGPR